MTAYVRVKSVPLNACDDLALVVATLMEGAAPQAPPHGLLNRLAITAQHVRQQEGAPAAGATTAATGGFDTVLAGGMVIDPESGLQAIRNVGIKSGQIVAISEAPLTGGAVVDCSGMVVGPGFIDVKVSEFV